MYNTHITHTHTLFKSKMRLFALYVRAWFIYLFFVILNRIEYYIFKIEYYTKSFMISAKYKIYTLYQSKNYERFSDFLKKMFFCFRAIVLTTQGGHDYRIVVNFYILCIADVVDHFSLRRRYSNSKNINELLRESNALLKIKNIQERELILKTSEKQLLFLNSERDRLIEVIIDLQMELDHRDQEEYS